MQILSPLGLAEKYRERAAVVVNEGKEETPKTEKEE